MDERRKEDIRLVLLGRTGAGKSATGNTILTRKEFQSNVSSTSVTSQCKIGEKQIEGSRYLVVDTPGLFDTNFTEGEITKEIIRCIHMSLPGPHAFLLVLRTDRFTMEEIDTFNRIFELFGEDMSQFAVILFTRLDDLEQEESTIERFVETASEKLKTFIRKCNGRYVAFNNRGNDSQKASCVSKLTTILSQMIRDNSEKFYTNQMYEQAEAEVQRKIREVERQKALEKNREVEEIQSQFKGELDKIQADNQELKVINEEIQRKRTDDLKQMQQENQRQSEMYIKKMSEDAERMHKQLIQLKEEETQRRKDDNAIRQEEMRNLRRAIESIDTGPSCTIQ